MTDSQARQELETQIADLLGSLDQIARDRDDYDYGLPLYSEASEPQLVNACKEFADKVWQASRRSTLLEVEMLLRAECTGAGPSAVEDPGILWAADFVKGMARL